MHKNNYSVQIRAFKEMEVPDVQSVFFFKKKIEEQEALLLMHARYMKKRQEYQNKDNMCFIDYRKSLDYVRHAKLWCSLKKMGISEHLVVPMRNVYTCQEATIQIEHVETDCFQVCKAVR